MILLVGLGNPGAKYARNRHNAGFHAAMAIAERQGFGPERQKFQGLVREGKLGTEKALILCPQTFYNESGNAVAAAARFYKIPPEDIVVFHDEIDLAPGKLRVKRGGGLAGNNGLRSIAAHMGPEFWRVRIGIGHPGRKDAVTNWVLGDFSKAEAEGYYDDLLDGIGRAATHLARIDDVAASRFMSEVVQPGGGQAAPDRKGNRKPPADPKPPAATSQNPAKKPASPFDALRKLKGD